MWIIQRTYQYRISVNALEFMHESILPWDDKAKPVGFLPPTCSATNKDVSCSGKECPQQAATCSWDSPEEVADR